MEQISQAAFLAASSGGEPMNDWAVRTMLRIGWEKRWKIVKRPSWFHPYRRVMWVHNWGRVKCRRVLISPRRAGIIRGVTD